YQPARRKCSNHIRPVDRWPRTSPRRHHLGLQRRLERFAGMVTVPTSVGAQLVQNPALDSPIRHHVADRGHLGNSPALGQRQPHRLGLPRPPMIPQVGTPHARILNEATNTHFARIKGDSTRVRLDIVESMFDSLVAAADGTVGAGAAGAWARVENAACARRLASTADMVEARWAADGSAEREQWCVDNWDAVAAEVAAAQNVSTGVASHQLMVAMALRERLPRGAEVFATGAISYRLVCAIVARTRLVQDPQARVQVDAALAAEVAGWGALSVAKAEAAIDWWVDRFDPGALRRTELSSRGRHLDGVPNDDGSGLSYIEGKLYAHDAAAL